jgi:hypothetical protein
MDIQILYGAIVAVILGLVLFNAVPRLMRSLLKPSLNPYRRENIDSKRF